MAGEIINRVASSKLQTIDLEDFYPSGERVLFDLKHWLYQELILKEQDFRTSVNEHDWSVYSDKYVGIICSSDAIIPSWAYLLISISLSPYAKKVVVGNSELLESMIFEEVVNAIELEPFQNRPVIIKGCSNKYIPETAYTSLIRRLLPVAKSLMFGEACSSVPLFKKKKG